MASNDNESQSAAAVANNGPLEPKEEDNSIKIKLISYEKTEFEIGLAAAKMSVTVSEMLDTFGYKEPIPLDNENVTDAALKKIVEWCEYHWDDPPLDPDFDDEKDRRNEELSYWDKQYIAIDDWALIYDIVNSANYMNIKGLVEVCGKHICNQIKGLTCQQVRDKLKITNDFTAEEEEAIHKENEWIYSKD